ncbi:acetylglutamate kinase [Marinilabilia salmonicolor]|jgi:acetylglutamate kinase|uniref:Acetylglutamate kinase n=1 Tax=Marinilabilia salmonicolor TaxID=989 RepID=A0A2T0XT30_9BACT|nr:acetylglutamate kinase [Marinilabilia salmonicolor]PRZ02077.1 N-acetylglutamate kinase [Marinilabilia salmonicolor]RCW39511.1 N-acetylglutamate kinase [Marinilabilia salmonicolor]
MDQKLTIVKVGGKVLESPETLHDFLEDFSALPGPKVLVHGGGRSATTMAKRLGIETKMVEGRRITDEDMLEVVTMVYGGLVNKTVVAGLQAMDINAMGITGADLNLIKAHKRTGSDVDYGFVGDVDEVNISPVIPLLKQGIVPVIAPLTHDGQGTLLNTNADTIASSLAVGFSEVMETRLMFCFEKPGVLINPDDDTSVIPFLNRELFNMYRNEGIISEGMVPKLENGFASLGNGVAEVVITNTEGLSVPGSGTTLGE